MSKRRPRPSRKPTATPDLGDIQRYGVRLTEDEARPDGKGGVLLTARGALKAIFLAQEEEASSGPTRARVRRYKEVVRALLSAEQAKTHPREALEARGVEVSGGAGTPQKEVALFQHLMTTLNDPVFGHPEIVACIGIHNTWYVVRPKRALLALAQLPAEPTSKAEAIRAIIATAAR